MIVFTNHAEEKLIQRGIKKELVLSTLDSPDKIKASFGNRKLAFKKFTKIYLCVVFRVEDGNTVVLTQHWVKNI